MLIIAFVCKGIQIIPSDKVIGLFLLFYSLHADGVMTLLMTPVKEISFDLALELIAQTGTEQALFTNTGLDDFFFVLFLVKVSLLLLTYLKSVC